MGKPKKYFKSMVLLKEAAVRCNGDGDDLRTHW
jgi:hypothetical protein